MGITFLQFNLCEWLPCSTKPAALTYISYKDTIFCYWVKVHIFFNGLWLYFLDGLLNIPLLLFLPLYRWVFMNQETISQDGKMCPRWDEHDSESDTEEGVLSLTNTTNWIPDFIHADPTSLFPCDICTSCQPTPPHRDIHWGSWTIKSCSGIVKQNCKPVLLQPPTQNISVLRNGIFFCLGLYGFASTFILTAARHLQQL